MLPTDLDPVSPESSKDSADESENMLEESGIIKQHDDSMESQLSGISDLTSHGSNHGESEIKNEDLNDDSQQSKISSSSKYVLIFFIRISLYFVSLSVVE